MFWLTPLVWSFTRPAPRFADRTAAGQALAAQLRSYAGRPDVVVLALPRGGVPVAFEVAQALGAPLDLVLVRKLGVPHQPELAMGAIAEGDVLVLNDTVLRELALTADELAVVAATEGRELRRRSQLYRAGRPALALCGRTVILVDDGLATGTTMQSAIAAVRVHQPAGVIVAVPVAARATVERLRGLVDALVAVAQPERLSALGFWYEDFTQTSDDEVRALLRQSR